MLEIREYKRLPSTKKFKEELSRSVRITTRELSQLIQVGIPSMQEIWVHLQIAIH